MKHYVYRITNIKLNLYYYGTRTTKLNPSKDIGYIYFSSSSDKNFIDDQKQNPQNYKYKVVSVFGTRKQAIKLEIKLHNKFDVGLNEKFYNRAKQTSTGFDMTGTKHIHSEERKLINSKAQIGKKLSQATKDKMSIAKKGISLSKEHIEKLKLAKQNMSQATKDKMSIAKKGIKHSDEHKAKNSLKHIDKIIVKNILTNEVYQVTRIEFEKDNNLVGYKTIPIKIYNEKHEIIYISTYSFRKFCKDNNLVYTAFYKSLQENGSKLYENISGKELKRIQNNGNIKFQNWYAKK